MVLVGLTSLAWSVVLFALVLAYKFGPPDAGRVNVALAAVVAVLGVVNAVVA